MSNVKNKIYMGTDSGATTTKIAAVRGDGEPLGQDVVQRPTESAAGRDGVIIGWIRAMDDYLAGHDLDWDDVGGVGGRDAGRECAYGDVPADRAGGCGDLERGVAA
jgi:glucokinase